MCAGPPAVVRRPPAPTRTPVRGGGWRESGARGGPRRDAPSNRGQEPLSGADHATQCEHPAGVRVLSHLRVYRREGLADTSFWRPPPPARPARRAADPHRRRASFPPTRGPPRCARGVASASSPAALSSLPPQFQRRGICPALAPRCGSSCFVIFLFPHTVYRLLAARAESGATDPTRVACVARVRRWIKARGLALAASLLRAVLAHIPYRIRMTSWAMVTPARWYPLPHFPHVLEPSLHDAFFQCFSWPHANILWLDIIMLPPATIWMSLEVS